MAFLETLLKYFSTPKIHFLSPSSSLNEDDILNTSMQDEDMEDVMDVEEVNHQGIKSRSIHYQQPPMKYYFEHVTGRQSSPDVNLIYDAVDKSAFIPKFSFLIINWTPTITEGYHLRYPQSLNLDVLNASCLDNRGKEVIGKFVYSPDIGTVLSAGNHTLLVTFIPKDFNRYKSISETVDIKIGKGTPLLEWILPSPTLEFGKPLTSDFLNCCCPTLEGGSMTYSHELGVVLNRGKIKLSCQYIPQDTNNFKNGYLSATLLIVPPKAPIIWNNPSPIHFSVPLSKSQLSAYPSVNDVDGDYIYTPPIGTVLPIGTHILSLQFLSSNPALYWNFEATTTVTVLKGVPELLWNKPYSLYEDDPLTEASLNCACLNCHGTFTYDPPLGTRLSIGEHILSVAFVPFDQNFDASTLTVTQRVSRKQAVKLYFIEADAITYPSPLSKVQLNATVSSSVPGNMVFDPPMGTILEAGEHELKATFFPVSKSMKITALSNVLTVLKGKPMLQWSTPASLEATPLSNIQLNCLCTNLEGGKFKYDPSYGATLPIGKHTLKVLYIPKDKKNYNSAETFVNISVMGKMRVKPEIIWGPIDDISYNDVLKEKQCNASLVKPIVGRFEYIPPEGTMLEVGTHTLKVTFIPKNVDHYLTVYAENRITITKAYPKLICSDIELNYGTPLGPTHLCSRVQGGWIRGKFQYEPGLSTILEAGAHEIKCFFTPFESNYFPVQGVIRAFVWRAYPRLEWASTVKSIVYPAPLTKTIHLNPVCMTENCKGKFKLSAKYGAVLPAGQHTLSARYYPDDIVNYFSSDIDFQIEVHQGTPKLFWQPVTAIIQYGDPLTDAQLCAYSNLPGGGEYIYNPPKGSLLSCGEHTVTVTFCPSNSQNYISVTESAIINVIPNEPYILWPSANKRVSYGYKISDSDLCAQLCPQQNSAEDLVELSTGIFAYDPPLDTILDASDDAQTLSVTFTPPLECKNFRATSKSISIFVKKSTPPIQWSAPTQLFPYMTPLTGEILNAVCTEPFFKGHFEYSHRFGAVLPVGRHQIFCKFIPDNPRNLHSTSAKIYVEYYKITPKIIWKEPSPIPCGHKLSQVELCASTVGDVEGTYTYDPCLGTTLKLVGAHDLSVRFVPSDKKNYNIPGVVNVQVTVTRKQILQRKIPATLPLRMPEN